MKKEDFFSISLLDTNSWYELLGCIKDKLEHDNLLCKRHFFHRKFRFK